MTRPAACAPPEPALAARRGAAIAALCAALAALPAGAETPLDGPAFAALVEGRTLYFDRWGLPYGAEQYLPGRQVVWRFEGGDCLPGRWFPRDGAICFEYEIEPGAVCWSVLDTETGIRIRELGDVPGNDLTIRRTTPAPLPCPGEFLGS